MAAIIVLGELCEDILMHHPASVEVMGRKIWAKDVVMTAGGSAFYTGAALKALGADVTVCSVIGPDEAGMRILRLLEQAEIDCSLLHLAQGQSTTISMMVCDGAEKTFIGCSPMLPMALPPAQALRDAKLLYIAGYTLYPEFWTDEMLALCQRAKADGCRIAMDSQLLPVETQDLAHFSRLDRLLPLVDLFFAARKDATCLFGTADAAKCYEIMVAMGFHGLMILKRGEDGCCAVSREGKAEAPAYRVRAYDTVGAGDVFGASCCWAWLQGWKTERCLHFAAAYTALSIREYTGKKHFPSAAEAERLLLHKSETGDGRQ